HADRRAGERPRQGGRRKRHARRLVRPRHPRRGRRLGHLQDHSYGLFAGSPSATIATVGDSGGSGTDALVYYGAQAGDAFAIRSSSVIDNAESVSYSGIEGSLTVYGGGTGTDLFSVVSSPVGGVVLDGEDGSDTYTVHWGSLVGNVQIIDRGSSGTDKLALE